MGDYHWNPANMGPLLASKAVDFITEAPTDKPFFVYYCSQAVHLPHTPPDSLDGHKIRGTSPSLHLDMVRELDVQVGMLIKALKASGQYDNTLFVFTSDNGGLLIKQTIDAGHLSPAVYRGGKNQVFEGGHRVPFIVRWPDRIKGGGLSPKLVSGTDILGTLANLTGQSLEPNQGMDSHDFLSPVLGQPDATFRDFLLIQGGTDRKVIYRDGDWKLIMQYDFKTGEITPLSLFNLRKNVKESPAGDLIDSPGQKSRVGRMLARYTSIRTGKLRTDGQVLVVDP
jgi:arylsulfatase A-like enzyme